LAQYLINKQNHNPVLYERSSAPWYDISAGYYYRQTAGYYYRQTAGLLGDPLGTLMSQPTERRSANFSIYSFNYGEGREMPTIGRY